MPHTRGKKGHGGERKYGNNKEKCQKYRAEGRRAKHKAARIAKQKKFEAKKRAKREARRAVQVAISA